MFLPKFIKIGFEGMEKKEKRIKRVKLAVILLLGLSLLFLLVVPLSKKAFYCVTDMTLKILRPDNIVLSLNNIYSQNLRDKVSLFVSSYFKDHEIDKLNLSEFDSNIKNTFKFIKNVEWDFSLPKVARLKLIGRQPVCFLNKKYILSDNNNLFALDDFQDYRISFSKELFIEQKIVSDNTFVFLKQVPDRFWNEYKLDYRNKTEIKLTPQVKTVPVINSFLSNKKQLTTGNFFDKEKLDRANDIFENLYKNKKLFVSRKYVLDLRFDNRILLRKENAVNRGRG